MELLILVLVLALIAALLTYAFAKTWRKAIQRPEAPPLLAILRSLGSAPENLDVETTAVALRRCTFCSSAEICRQKLDAGLPMPDYCPNAAFLTSVRKPRTA